MKWNDFWFDYWCENYYNLRDYELNPFGERRDVFRGEGFIRGTTLSEPPMEELFDANWQFDKAIKSLNKLDERVFKLRYLEGYELGDIKEMLDAPYKDIKESWYTVKGKLVKYLLEVRSD